MFILQLCTAILQLCKVIVLGTSDESCTIFAFCCLIFVLDLCSTRGSRLFLEASASSSARAAANGPVAFLVHYLVS